MIGRKQWAFALVAVLLSGCATVVPQKTMLDQYVSIPPPQDIDITTWKQDRAQFIQIMSKYRDDVESDAHNGVIRRRIFASVGIVAGACGAAFADNENVALTSGLAGAVAAGLDPVWNIVSSTERNQTIAQYLRWKIPSFQAKWTDAAYPQSSEALQEYLNEKEEIRSTIDELQKTG